MQKFIILISIIALILASFVAFLFVKNKNAEEEQEKNTISTKENTPTEIRKIYQNQEYGFKFDYTKNKELKNLSDDLDYRDLITGEYKKDNLFDLMKKAEFHSKDLLESAYDYYLGKIGILELEDIIPGVSLDTGKIDFSVESIVYTKY